MIYSIEEIKQIAIPIVSEYGIARLGIFGSYARGEANEDSDLDFIMDTDGLIGMIQYNANCTIGCTIFFIYYFAFFFYFVFFGDFFRS